jgi:hypothetical protein
LAVTVPALTSRALLLTPVVGWAILDFEARFGWRTFSPRCLFFHSPGPADRAVGFRPCGPVV